MRVAPFSGLGRRLQLSGQLHLELFEIHTVGLGLLDDYATKDQRRSYWISVNARF